MRQLVKRLKELNIFYEQSCVGGGTTALHKSTENFNEAVALELLEFGGICSLLRLDRGGKLALDQVPEAHRAKLLYFAFWADSDDDSARFNSFEREIQKVGRSSRRTDLFKKTGDLCISCYRGHISAVSPRRASAFGYLSANLIVL